MVHWPDFTFPPINLYNAPRQPNLPYTIKNRPTTVKKPTGKQGMSLRRLLSTIRDHK